MIGREIDVIGREIDAKGRGIVIIRLFTTVDHRLVIEHHQVLDAAHIALDPVRHLTTVDARIGEAIID